MSGAAYSVDQVKAAICKTLRELDAAAPPEPGAMPKVTADGDVVNIDWRPVAEEAVRQALRDFGTGRPRVVPVDGAAAIVRALASTNPEADLGYYGEGPVCRLCEVDMPGDMNPKNMAPHVGKHLEGCPWARAVAWVSAHDGPEAEPEVEPEVEPPLWDDGEGPEPWQGQAR